MLFRRFTSVLMIALGLIGLAACAAGAYAVWKVESRLQQANERAFALVDRGLGAVEDRVRRTRQSVEQSRITTSEITKSVRDWSARKIEDRLVTQLEIEARTEKLAGQLLVADQWLDSSADSIRDLQQVLEVGRSLGAEVDPASLEETLATLGSIRGRLQEAEQSVAELRGFATAVQGESDENRVARVLKLLARVLVTITEIGPRLERLADRISGTRADASEAKAKTSSYVLWTSIGCSAILAWIAAGQFALCIWGRNRWRPGGVGP